MMRQASRALSRGNFNEAIHVLAEKLPLLEAERAVAVMATTDSARKPRTGSRLRVLVDEAERVMCRPGWSFTDVAAALELCQASLPSKLRAA